MSRSFQTYALAVITFALGFIVAVRSFRYEIQVDHDSGSLRQLMGIGPFTVRTMDHPANYLGSLMLPGGGNGLTGIPKWKVGMRFYGNSQRCPSSLEAMLVNQLITVDGLLKAVPSAKASELKATFLSKLQSEREGAAMWFLDSSQTNLWDEIERARR